MLWKTFRRKKLVAMPDGSRSVSELPTAIEPRWATFLETLGEQTRQEQPYAARHKLMGEVSSPCVVELDLAGFNLEDCVFTHVRFERNAILDEASFKGSTFNSVVFDAEASLENCDFSE